MSEELRSRFWSMSNREVAALTGEQVETFVKYEAMSAGVGDATPPVFEIVPETPILATTTYYTVTGFDAVFRTAAQAQAFLDLNPGKSEYSYKYGYDRVNWFEPGEGIRSVTETVLRDKNEVSAAGPELERIKEVEESNRKKQQEFDKAHKAFAEATSGVWSRWHEAQSRVTEWQTILDTFEEYKELTDGDERTARVFLQKRFDTVEIEIAFGERNEDGEMIPVPESEA